MKDFSLRPCLHLMRRKNGLKKQAASPTGKNCFGRARGSRTDYRRYRLSASEWAANGAMGAALAGLVAYTFYHSFSLFLFLLPFGLIGLPLYRRKALLKKRQWRLTLQFKEAAGILSSFLGAGYSVENAFFATERELENLYGKKAMITEEFLYISGQLRLHKPVEALLLELSERSGIEDIRNFTEVFSIAKRSGGELCSIIDHTVTVIREKLSVMEEINNLTAARRFEQRIMNFMPFGIILYVELSSSGFFDVMYQTLLGRCIMTVCLAAYIGACVLSERIMDIRV